jgi:hypothetical protein
MFLCIYPPEYSIIDRTRQTNNNLLFDKILCKIFHLIFDRFLMDFIIGRLNWILRLELVLNRLQKWLKLESWWDLARTIKAKLRVAYIPGHCGLSFNEIADTCKLAGEAETFGELIRTPGDVLLELSNQMEQGEQQMQEQAWSAERMAERGDGCCLLDRGGYRRVRNRTELGVM